MPMVHHPTNINSRYYSAVKAAMKAGEKSQSTPRAPDAGDSAPFSGIFLRLGIFLVGRLRRPRPSAGIPYRGLTRADGQRSDMKKLSR